MLSFFVILSLHPRQTLLFVALPPLCCTLLQKSEAYPHCFQSLPRSLQKCGGVTRSATCNPRAKRISSAFNHIRTLLQKRGDGITSLALFRSYLRSCARERNTSPVISAPCALL